MDDLFQEIEEDLRQEKLEKFWKQYGRYLISAAVVLVVGTGGYSYWKHYKADESLKLSVQYSTALELAHKGNPLEAIKALEEILKHQGTAYSSLAQLKIADIHSQLKNTKDASASYKNLAADKKSDSVFREVATLFEGLNSLDDAKSTGAIDLLKSASDKNSNPWRLNARELAGWANIQLGTSKEAATIFHELATNQFVSEGVALRAQIMAQKMPVSDVSSNPKKAEDSSKAPQATTPKAQTPRKP